MRDHKKKSWKILVLEELSHGKKDWKELLKSTDLAPDMLNTALKELFDLEYIYKDYEYYFITRGGKKFLEKRLQSEQKKPEKTNNEENRTLNFPRGIKKIGGKIFKGTNDLEWIKTWYPEKYDPDKNGMDHFFLTHDLSSFVEQAINKSKKEIIIVNPFVRENNLLNALIKRIIKNDGLNVLLITLDPDDAYDYGFYRRNKRLAKDALNKLMNYGVRVVYRLKIHAKVFLIDNKIAIVSSMNLYGGSVGGDSIEAGIVSTSRSVVSQTREWIDYYLLDKKLTNNSS